MTSYKRKLGWDDSRVDGPVAATSQADRKPLFTVLAITIALVAAGVSVSLYSGAPSGFEGWGSMVVGAVIGFLGAPLGLVLSFVALAREKKYLWVNLISIAICLMTILWLYSQN